jgi:hypothetical protein
MWFPENLATIHTAVHTEHDPHPLCYLMTLIYQLLSYTDVNPDFSLKGKNKECLRIKCDILVRQRMGKLHSKELHYTLLTKY